jgi:hypothetical protein
VLLEKNQPETEPKTAIASDPQALIEEARQRQRRRTRRRIIALQVAAWLIVLGVGVSQFARGHSSTGPAPTRPVAGSAQAPTVTYTKAILQKFVPRIPVETQTLETWSASNSPLVSRTVVTIAGGPRFEYGLGPEHDKLLGVHQTNYLFDPSTQTNWRISSFPVPPPLEQTFKQRLAEYGNRLAATRMYIGRSVYVLRLRMSTGEQTYYIDTRTFEPLMIDMNDGYHLRTVYQTVIYQTFPATKSNLALTSLPTAHPRAKTVLHPTQHMRDLHIYTVGCGPLWTQGAAF